MFCSKCGKEINDGSSFCQFCGAAQSQSSPATNQQPAQQYNAPTSNTIPNQYQDQPIPQSPYNNIPVAPIPPKKKSKLPLIVVITIAIILIPIIFIGVIGSVFGIKDDAEVNNATEIISENFDFNDTANLTDAVKEADVHIFEMEQNGAKIQHTYYCNGDIVKTWVQTVTVNLEGTSQDEKDAFVDQCNQEWEDKYSQYTFIEHSVEVVNEELIEIYKFNDVSNHVDDLKELGLIQKNGSVVTLFISYKQTRDMLLAQGFTEIQ